MQHQIYMITNVRRNALYVSHIFLHELFLRLLASFSCRLVVGVDVQVPDELGVHIVCHMSI